MKHFFGKTHFAVSVAVGIFIFSIVAVAPQASAQSLERQVKQLESQLKAIQDALAEVKSKSVQEAQKVREIEKIATSAKETTQRNNSKKHMVFFRGGFTHAMRNRNGSSIRSNVTPVGFQDQADKDGWYIGAGFDWHLTDNVWGALPKTSVFAELMFEYKHFGDKVQGNGALGNVPSMLAGGAVNPRKVTVSQFSLTAAPKIKFMEGSKLRPWIIPAGLALHVVSPTTESVTYLVPGVMFAAGLDYNIWQDFYIGIDGRYHLTAGKTDGVKIDGMTAGGYLAIGF
tara:strand:+ start:902 stop:1756 length:855 start_codon:yes stop_codon:yes gene_type:complete